MRNYPASSSRRAALAKPRRDSADTDAIPNHRVVSIHRPEQPDAHKPRLVASDATTQRIIFGIGRKRIAFDFTTRITHLEPETGDAPAPVLPWKKGPNGKKDGQQG